MKTSQSPAKRVVKAAPGGKKAPRKRQADKLYKKKRQTHNARKQFRVKTPFAKGKPTRYHYPTRASQSKGSDLPQRRRIQKRNNTALRRITGEEVATFLKDHVDRVESAVALLEVLPDILRKCDEGIKRLEDELREIKKGVDVLKDDQEPWEVPVLPDHLMDTVFPPGQSDPHASEEEEELLEPVPM